MRIISILIILMVAGVFAYKQVSLTQVDCDNPPKPVVTAVLDIPEPLLDKDKTVKQITAMYKGHHGHAALPSNNFAPAITRSEVKASASYISPKQRASLTGKYCFVPGEVNVNVTLNQIVYIARSAYGDDCRFDAAMEHEMKHIFIGSEVVKKNIARFEKNIEGAYAYFMSEVGGGPFDAQTAAGLEEELGKYTQTAVDISIEEIMAEIGKYQKVVDTPEEYRRIGSLCNWR